MLAAISARCMRSEFGASIDPELLEEPHAESVTFAAGFKVRAVDGVVRGDAAEDIEIAGFAGSGEPLDAVFVGARLEAEKFGDAAVEFADGIGIENFVFESEAIPFPAPFGAAAQVALAIERNDSGVVEGRRIVRGGGMRGVMVDRNNARFRKHAQRDRQVGAGRQRPRQRDVVDLGGTDAGDAAGRSRWRFRASRPGLWTARELRFLDGRGDAAVLE